MRRFLVAPHFAGGYQVMRVVGPRVVFHCLASTEPDALRVAELLDRFGLVDLPMPEGVADPSL